MGKIGRRYKGKKKHRKMDDDDASAIPALEPLPRNPDGDDDDDDDDDPPLPPASYDDLLDSALKEVDAAPMEMINSELCRRQAIAYLFVQVYKCPPPSEWKGRDGVIPRIRDTLGIPATTKLDSILEDIMACEASGKQYSGHRRTARAFKPCVLATNSVEAQIVADCLEDGFSLVQATNLVNKHRMDNDEDLVSNSAVYSLSKRLQPQVSPIKKLKQGDTDPTSDWAVSRHHWVMQLLCRFGFRDKLVADELLLPDGTVPPYFDEEKLRPYKIQVKHIAWWDETHRKCTIGSATAQAGRKLQFKFKRNEFGQIDLKNGTFSDDDKVELKVKFPQEVRLCLGVASNPDVDGNDQGIMLKPFDYSGKVVLTIKDYNAKMDAEMGRIRKLTGGKGAGWIVSERDEDELYCDDPLSAIGGIGIKTLEKLAEFDVKTIADFSHVTDEDLQAMVKARIGSWDRLFDWREQCDEAMKRPPAPPDIDFRKHSNPYLARYGTGQWEEKLKNCYHMAGYVCITDMVQHIHDETEALFRGQTFNWGFYHDALSLMTAKDTIAWMKENHIYIRWILPELGLNAERKHFANAPVGNSPEFMPLDNSLNKDIHDGVDRHVLYTSHLEEDDPRKFSMTTPARGAAAYKRVLEGVPPSSRIVQDVNKAIESMLVIHQHKGAVVQGLGNRNGWRAQVANSTLFAHGAKSRRGGARKRDATKQKDYLKNCWWHPDARAEMDVKLEASIAKRTRVSSSCQLCMLCLLFSLSTVLTKIFVVSYSHLFFYFCLLLLLVTSLPQRTS